MNKDDLNKQLKKEINKSISQIIYQKFMKMLLVIVIIISAVSYGANWIDTHVYLTPYNIEALTDEDRTRLFPALMKTMMQLIYPNTTLYILPYTDKNSSSFYINAQLDMDIDTSEWGILSDRAHNLFLDFTAGKLSEQKPATNFSYNPGFFQMKHTDSIGNTIGLGVSVKTALADIQSLENTARIGAYLIFKEPLTADEFVEWMQQYPDFTYSWLASYVKDDLLEGFPLINTAYALSDTSTALYPHLSRTNKPFETGDELKEHYLSILKMLADYPSFTSAFLDYYPDRQLDMEKRLARTKDNFEVYAVRIIATKEALGDLLNDTHLSGMFIRETR